MEDRIHAEGKGDELVEAIETFEATPKTRADQQILYDELVSLGAQPEEADEYVNLLMQ